MNLRLFKESDAPKLASLFFSTVREVNIADYTPEQVRAWVPDLPSKDMKKWNNSFKNKFIIVAEKNGEIAGFGELEPNGHIDRFYIGKNFIRQGVGQFIYDALEKEALKKFLPELFVEASITAKPFFKKQGFVIEKAQEVERLGVKLPNFVMRKKLVELI